LDRRWGEVTPGEFRGQYGTFLREILKDMVGKTLKEGSKEKGNGGVKEDLKMTRKDSTGVPELQKGPGGGLQNVAVISNKERNLT